MSNFQTCVLDLIQRIPSGSVATYGQIAALAGSPRAARQVGQILRGLKNNPKSTEIPWQRVVNRLGGLSTWKIDAGELQQAMLEGEGIIFDADGYCSLSTYLWQADLDASTSL